MTNDAEKINRYIYINRVDHLSNILAELPEDNEYFEVKGDMLELATFLLPKLDNWYQSLLEEERKKTAKEVIDYLFIDHVTNPKDEFDKGRDYVLDSLHERIRLYKNYYLTQGKEGEGEGD